MDLEVIQFDPEVLCYDVCDLIRPRLRDKKITLDVSGEAKELLMEEGFDPNYGARPLKRIIQQLLENQLAEKILDGEIVEGDKIKIDAQENKIVFSKL